MVISEICIKRPVLASMMSLALVLFGLVALQRLPVRELPDIDPPIVTVTSVFPGANAGVVETEVTEKLEEAINSVEGIRRLTSESREQVSSINIEFDLSRDIDLAAQDVRDRVARVRGALPDVIDEPIVAKQDADANPVIWIALFSDRYNTLELTDLAENFMKDRLQTVPGVSSIFIGGQKRFAIRLRLEADRMAAQQITIQDIEFALQRQNVEIPSGRVEGRERELTIQTLGEMKTPAEFNRLVIARRGETLVRLEDVGRAEVGVEDERSIARFNAKPSVGLGIVKQSKANTIEVARGIKAELARIVPLLPEGVETFLPYDESVFVEDSIRQVWVTLGVAFLLVMATIFVFLRNVRSTLIPVLTIPVAVIGTFFVLGLMGYSINILTMLALVLTIGIVVDDSIVVLENIYRHIEEGLSPMQAAFRGMREIAFAIIATTLALCAVFIPLAFQTTITGRLFIEFAIALAGSVVISSFVALTLTPAVAARVLKPIDQVRHGRVFNAFERALIHFAEHYRRILTWALHHRPIVVGASLLLFAVAFWGFTRLPNDFLPEEDKGRLLVFTIAPEGATTEYTDRALKQIEAIAQETPEVEAFFAALGLSRGGPGRANEAFMFMRLKADRERSVGDIVAGPRGLGARLFGEVPGAFSIPIIPKAISRGFGQPFQLVIQEQELDRLNDSAAAVANRLRASGLLMNVRSSFEINKPELRIEIDRDRAADLGVTVADLARTLQVLFGGLDLSKVKLGGKEYDVIAQLDRESRLVPSDLDRLYIRGASGRLVALNNVARYTEGAAPSTISRFNRLRSATLEGTPAGVPLGTAMEAVETILRTEFPGLRYDWTGESADLRESGQGFLFVVLLALLITYMVLAAQFESLLHPLTIMLTLPLAAIGAIGLLWLLNGVDALGAIFYAMAHYAPEAPAWAARASAIVPRIPAMNINLFSQIGLVLLIGLATKNSILLVEFANQQTAKGASAMDAMLEAGRIRFRPILMTSLSTILGILPIAIGFGAGGESRRPMGVAAVGGMLTGTFFTLLLVPVAYTLFSDWGRRLRTRFGQARPPVSPLLLLTVGAALAATAVLPARAEPIAEPPPPAYDLARCLDTALEHNHTIRKARERIARQAGTLDATHARRLPTLAVHGAFERQDEAIVRIPGFEESWHLGLGVSQPIYAGGAQAAAQRQQEELLEAARLDLRITIDDVILDVRERHAAALLARSQIGVQEENLRVLREELESARNKFDVGAVSPFEVLRAEVALASGQTPYIRARNQYRLALEALAQTLGLDLPPGDEAPLNLTDELDATAAPAIALHQARAAAQDQRAELRRLERLETAQAAALRGTRSGYQPSLSAVADYRFQRAPDAIDRWDNEDGWTAGLQLTWTLFDGRGTPARVRQAASELALAQLDLEQAALDIDVAVRRAYSSTIEARELVQATGRVVEQAEESLRLARSRYDAGAATQLDVLTAQAQLTQARDQALQALHDHTVAQARLMRAMGASGP